MTCIVGMTTPNNGVLIGGDSAGVMDYDIQSRADEKVFRRGEMLFGFTGSFRMGQLLHYGRLVCPHKDESDLMRWMVGCFVNAARSLFDEGGVSRKDGDAETCGTFLVGMRGRLFLVDSDYQVGESRDGIFALGCGANIALGSLYSTEGRPPRTRARIALEAAARYSAGVRGPFKILQVGGRR
jgi:ATP-dependent protease HslVU (ClpYQ) peptidase subunit